MSYKRVSNRTSLNDSIVSDIRLAALQGVSTSEIARVTGVHRKTVYNILEGNTWSHVPEPTRAYGFKDYLVFPDGRVYNPNTDAFLTTNERASGETTVRVRTSSGRRVTVPVATLVARAYHGSRAKNPTVTYVDGNPQNTHFTNISV